MRVTSSYWNGAGRNAATTQCLKTRVAFMKVNDAISGGIFLALAIFAFVQAGKFPAMPGVPYGPSLFPRLVAVVMGLGGAMLIWSGLKSARSEPWGALADWAYDPRSYLIFFSIIGSVVAYILLADILGFLLISFLLLLLLFCVTRGVRPLASNLVIAAVTSVLIYFVFAEMLRVPLPYGVVETLLPN